MNKFSKYTRYYFSVLNNSSFHQEPLDLTNTYNRINMYEKYINQKYDYIDGFASQEEIVIFLLNILKIYGQINLQKFLVYLWVVIKDRQDNKLIQKYIKKIFNSLIDGLISGGINMLDTSINFRYQKSERVFRAILNYLIQEKFFQRSEIIIGTKGGYIHEDADKGIDYDQIIKDLIQKKILQDPKNEIFEMNCIEPKFIEYQFQQSLNNIGINQLDFYALNQPEVHLTYLNQQQWFQKLVKVFEILEKKVQDGLLQAYGISTWSCFRVNKSNKYYVNLNDLHNFVNDKLGKKNSFKLIYAPINILMPEVFIEKYQYDQKEQFDISFLQLATLLKYNVFGTSAFANGLATTIPLSSQFTKMSYQGAKHLNYLRSLPYDCLKSVIFSSLNNRHNKTNLSVCKGDYITTDELEAYLIESTIRKQVPEQEYDFDSLKIQLIFQEFQQIIMKKVPQNSQQKNQSNEKNDQPQNDEQNLEFQPKKKFLIPLRNYTQKSKQNTNLQDSFLQKKTIHIPNYKDSDQTLENRNFNNEKICEQNQNLDIDQNTQNQTYKNQQQIQYQNDLKDIFRMLREQIPKIIYENELRIQAEKMKEEQQKKEQQ